MIAIPLLLTALVGVGLAASASASPRDPLLDQYDAAMAKLSTNPERTDALPYAALVVSLTAAGHAAEATALLRKLEETGLSTGGAAISVASPGAAPSPIKPGDLVLCKPGYCVANPARPSPFVVSKVVVPPKAAVRVTGVAGNGLATFAYQPSPGAPLFVGQTHVDNLQRATSPEALSPTLAKGPSPFGWPT